MSGAHTQEPLHQRVCDYQPSTLLSMNPAEILLSKIRNAKEKIETSTIPKRKQLATKEKIYRLIVNGQESEANQELDKLRINEKIYGL